MKVSIDELTALYGHEIAPNSDEESSNSDLEVEITETTKNIEE